MSFWYNLTVTDSHNCSIIDSVYAVMNPLTDCITIYNTITPNGDGSNDVWIIGNIEMFKDSRIIVYNRFGNEVFNSTNYQNDWGGTYNDKPLPDGTYYYLIYLKHGEKPIKGHINIIR